MLPVKRMGFGQLSPGNQMISDGLSGYERHDGRVSPVHWSAAQPSPA